MCTHINQTHRYLQCRLNGVDRHDGYSPQSGRQRSRTCFDRKWEVVRLEEGEDANVGGRVAESRYRSLKKSWTEPAIEPQHSTLIPQRSKITL
jgi:hypothetical protein